MPFYKDHVYPQLVSMLGNPEPIQKVRQRIVSLAQGKVLEIGVGPGVNFVHCMALFTLLPAAFPYLAIAFPLARFAES
jgi:hypothetical protein